jgi:diguanylate cyclase (GGDEF)-like protein
MPQGRRDGHGGRAEHTAVVTVLTGLLAVALLARVRWLVGDGPAGLGLDAALALLAVVAALDAARRAAPGRSRAGWRCLAVGTLAWTLAPLTWLTGLPDVVATAGRAVLILGAGASAWLSAKSAQHTSARVRLLVDGLIGAAVVFIVAWTPVLDDVARASGDPATAVPTLGLPLAMVAVVTLVGGVALTEIPRGRRAMHRLYMWGLILVAVSDVLHDLGRPPLWAAAFGLVVLATRVYRGSSPRYETASTHPLLHYAPFLGLAPAVGTMAAHLVRGEMPDAVAAGAIVTGVLLIARQQATLVENRRLVARLEATERRLRHQAMHDSLTGLGGRALLHEQLDEAVAAHRARATPVAVAFIDLDDFKKINDVHGHAVGDHVLVVIAHRLAEALAPFGADAAAFRMSGDEFAVLLRGVAANRARHLAAGLLGTITEPVEVDHGLVSVSGSVGVARPGPGVPAESSALLRAADLAMYEVKHTGKGGVAQAPG